MDSENYLNVNFGPYSAGPGITISPSNVISTNISAPSFASITGDPDDNTALAMAFDAVDSEIATKQDALTAGFGIDISGNTISAAIGAGDGLEWTTDGGDAVLNVVSPLVGKDGIKVDGDWDSEGYEFSLDMSTTGAGVTSTPNKPTSGAAVSAYANNNFKKIQTAKSDPTASGTTTEFIASITQNAQGVITATKKAIDLSGINIGDGKLLISH